MWFLFSISINCLDPVIKTTLNSTNLEKTLKFWSDTLNMTPLSNAANTLTYSDAFQLEFRHLGMPLSFFVYSLFIKIIWILDVPINRAKAYGRIAFAVPFAVQELIDQRIKASNNTILTPLISLDTPGKATVRVIILADPDGHEICFVDEEGFSQLSAVDPESNAALDKYIKKDPFQQWLILYINSYYLRIKFVCNIFYYAWKLNVICFCYFDHVLVLFVYL